MRWQPSSRAIFLKAKLIKYLYKYPQREYPYRDLVETNRRRSRDEFEYELIDTGVFEDDRYFDVFIEYAKAAPQDLLIRITVHNRGPHCDNLRRILSRMLDPNEFLGDYGVRSLSACYKNHPYTLNLEGQVFTVLYELGRGIVALQKIGVVVLLVFARRQTASRLNDGLPRAFPFGGILRRKGHARP
jgi:hypothetical protein